MNTLCPGNRILRISGHPELTSEWIVGTPREKVLLSARIGVYISVLGVPGAKRFFKARYLLAASMKTRFWLLLVLSLVGLRSAHAWTVKLSEGQLQGRVNRLVPLEKRKLLMSVVISRIDVELREGHDRVGLNTHMEIRLPGYSTGKGTAYIEGKPVYRPEQGSFYFADAEVTSVSFENVPDKYDRTVRKLLQSALQRRLDKTAIYTLDDSKTKHQLARSLLKSVRVQDKKLVLELSVF